MINDVLEISYPQRERKRKKRHEWLSAVTLSEFQVIWRLFHFYMVYYHVIKSYVAPIPNEFGLY